MLGLATTTVDPIFAKSSGSPPTSNMAPWLKGTSHSLAEYRKQCQALPFKLRTVMCPPYRRVKPLHQSLKKLWLYFITTNCLLGSLLFCHWPDLHGTGLVFILGESTTSWSQKGVDGSIDLSFVPAWDSYLWSCFCFCFLNQHISTWG